MIDIKDVYKSFGPNDVLRGVNLRIETGETMVIIGRSGCGKSVLLKHILGLMQPDRGAILVDGEDLAAMSREELYRRRTRFGMLFQGAALFDSLDVASNIAFSLLEHSDFPPEKIDAVVREKMRMVDLPPSLRTKKPAALSGGQKKRVGLARAIACNPDIMLYDEPTTGLDPITADAINDLIREMQAKLGTTGVAVTHDMASAYKIADRIAMLDNGKIIEVGTPEEIRNTRNPIVDQFINGRAQPDPRLVSEWAGRAES